MFWTLYNERINYNGTAFEVNAEYAVNGKQQDYMANVKTLTEARKQLDAWRAEFRNHKQKENEDVRIEQSA